MAFLKDNETTGSNGSNSKKEDWQADAFLNFYLPDRSGERRKIGSIPLKKSRQTDKQLIDRLSADPSLSQKLLERMVCEYNSAELDETKKLDLDF